jgi:flagellar capping protein FliD
VLADSVITSLRHYLCPVHESVFGRTNLEHISRLEAEINQGVVLANDTTKRLSDFEEDVKRKFSVLNQQIDQLLAERQELS